MQREVRQLMTQYLQRIARVGRGAAALHNDPLFGGDGDRRAIFWRARTYQLAKASPVGCHHDHHALRGTRQPRIRIGGYGRIQQRTGELAIA